MRWVRRVLDAKEGIACVTSVKDKLARNAYRMEDTRNVRLQMEKSETIHLAADCWGPAKQLTCGGKNGYLAFIVDPFHIASVCLVSSKKGVIFCSISSS